jgi:hypothetical protein
MMEAVRASETSVNFNVTTRRCIPEDSKIPSRRCENLKSHNLVSKSVTQQVRGKTIPSNIVATRFKKYAKHPLHGGARDARFYLAIK